MIRTWKFAAALCVFAAADAFAARSAPAGTIIEVTIRNHRFVPAVIHVPAGKPVTLHIRNEDPLAEEFDSSALRVEKVIAGGHDGVVHLHALEKGRYSFVGEYHEDTAKGVVIAE